ncbi:hypothetical protein PACTADRAFT_48003 [Pachysolen tannophilus NRRL Y-2460]|uniref:Alpha-1,3-mannosyltransferase n=1 Tax=Pachysolen tannophilus NRRL Y-2460 TaxID=669874 RepID=A0A1E4U2G5_PACTA|nr:hypothetical protein PACTADRAFT_48003 [Pachysolen tannophilus NRRL Y-2460]
MSWNYIIQRFKRLKQITKAVLIIVAILEVTFLYSYKSFSDHSVIVTKVIEAPGRGLSYSHLIDIFGDDFAKESLDYKCKTYFEELYNYDPNWNLGDFKGLNFNVDLAKSSSLNKYIAKINKKLRKGVPLGERRELKEKIAEKAAQEEQVNLLIEDMIYNSVGHVKVFGKCFIDDKDREYGNFDDIETRLLPWLNKRLPTFISWDGKTVDDHLPMTNELKFSSSSSNSKRYAPQPYIEGTSFLKYLSKNMSGKGIVISCSDSLVEELVRLLRVLRFLHNDLPIEIVHKGDLDQNHRNTLIQAARDDLILSSDIKIDYSPQEIWFVDVSSCIKPDFLANDTFETFSNKWLASLFTSFDEMILLDSDAVPFFNPSYFFTHLKGYSETGGYFFKDREIDPLVEGSFLEFYKKLLPSAMDTKFFEIPQTTSSTNNNRLFGKKAKHFMESGMVLLKRSTHFSGLLMSVHLQLWVPTSSPVHGDKELFWLGQVLVGNENFKFNKNPAAASGLVDNTKFKAAKEICSIQPTHIADDDHTLLWVNSGLQICKKQTWNRDYLLRPYRKKKHTVESLQQYFESPFLINGAIIPPDSLDKYNNKAREPITGWSKADNLGCERYFFCARDRAGSADGDRYAKGILITYDEEEQMRFANISLVWVG